MSLEERLIDSDILDCCNMLLVNLDYLVDEQERIAVRNALADAVDIDDRRHVGIVYRRLDFCMLYLLAYHTCELVVDSMTRADSNDTALDGTAYESEVADDIHDFVTRRLIVPYQRFGIDVTELVYLHMGNLHHIAYVVDTLLRNLLVVDDDSVVKISP